MSKNVEEIKAELESAHDAPLYTKWCLAKRLIAALEKTIQHFQDMLCRKQKIQVELDQMDDAMCEELLDPRLDELTRLRKALMFIRDSPFCQYDYFNLYKDPDIPLPQYQIGVTDGHRHCATIAKLALKGNSS